jgi:hypothetical protein
MNERHTLTIDPSQPMIYQIRLRGHLGRPWTEWFGDVTITLEEGGEMLLTCPVADQAALYGLLRKVRDLGLPLISVTSAQTDQMDGPGFKRPAHCTRSSQLDSECE